MGKTSIVELLDIFESSWSALLEEFGIPQTWHRFYPESMLENHWLILNNRKIVWSPEPFTKESIEAGSVIYSAAIANYWEISKAACRKDGLIMILADTETDNNVALFVFDEDLECKDAALIEWADGYL